MFEQYFIQNIFHIGVKIYFVTKKYRAVENNYLFQREKGLVLKWLINYVF